MPNARLLDAEDEFMWFVLRQNTNNDKDKIIKKSKIKMENEGIRSTHDF